MLRGLFGSSARAFQPPLMADAEGISASMPIPQPIGQGVDPAARPAMSATMDRALPAEANMQRSLMGGLFKYQRPDGQTDPQRLALMGATLADFGQALNGGNGGNLARVQDRYRAEQQREKARGLMAKLYPDDPEAEMMLDLDPGVLTKAWSDKHAPAEWKPVEAEDGLYMVNPRDPSQLKKVASWTRKADDPIYQDYLRSQTAANQALVGQRENQGAYYGAKAKQPYAPPRARMGRAGGGGAAGGSAGALPPGWR